MTPFMLLIPIALLLILIVGYKFFIRILGMVIVPHDSVGIVTKKFGLGGSKSNLPDGKIIARFGSMVNLVTQVLEPTIGNYFRNAAQGSDEIEFLKADKTERTRC